MMMTMMQKKVWTIIWNSEELSQGGSQNQESLLVKVRRTSSSCSGAFTAEMALASLEKAVNSSKILKSQVCFKPISCHDPWLVNGLV